MKKQKRGMPLGDFHFKYFTMKPDEPYLYNDENYNHDVSKALFSFPHCIQSISKIRLKLIGILEKF